MQSNHKIHSGQSLMEYLQLIAKHLGGNPIYGHPVGSNTQILTKNDPKYWYYFQFGPFNNAK
jgi:hypothetical protein